MAIANPYLPNLEAQDKDLGDGWYRSGWFSSPETVAIPQKKARQAQPTQASSSAFSGNPYAGQSSGQGNGFQGFLTSIGANTATNFNPNTSMAINASDPANSTAMNPMQYRELEQSYIQKQIDLSSQMALADQQIQAAARQGDLNRASQLQQLKLQLQEQMRQLQLNIQADKEKQAAQIASSEKINTQNIGSQELQQTRSLGMQQFLNRVNNQEAKVNNQWGLLAGAYR